jgi:hypothetical protein
MDPDQQRTAEPVLGPSGARTRVRAQHPGNVRVSGRLGMSATATPATASTTSETAMQHAV